ncbi:UNVERIFIED_CONTAM: hypothetical protein HDU68_006251, partial [Siphonaria sp. JEL0065]
MVSGGGYTVHPSKDKSIHSGNEGSQSAGFLIKAVPSPDGSLYPAWIKTLSPAASATGNTSLFISDVKQIPSSKSVIVTGSFVGSSVSFPKSDISGDEVVLKGSSSSGVNVFVAKVLDSGAFEWAVTVEDVVPKEFLETAPSVNSSAVASEERKSSPQKDTPTSVQKGDVAIQIIPSAESVIPDSELGTEEMDRRDRLSSALTIKLPTKIAVDAKGEVIVAGTFSGVVGLGLKTKLK